MLEFFKKLFGNKSVATAAPYKVEAPAVTPAVKTTAKKSAVKKSTTRKPRAPKA
jgi:hypothetical protein